MLSPDPMRISVITPVYRARADWLAEAYQSVRDQVLPEGWTLEWLVQADGDDEPVPLPEEALADPHVLVAKGIQGGPAIARNLALARSTGGLVAVLDADDMLTAGALARSIDVLTRRPEYGWTTSKALDLMPSGELIEPPTDRRVAPVTEGLLPRGFIFERWRNRSYHLAVHPATLCIRREWLMAVGGWMAMPAAEDAGLLLAVEAMVPGYYIGTPGLHYRLHEGQITRTLTAETRPERLEILAERVRAIQTLLVKPIHRWQPGDREGGSSGLS
ncbi:glycosyltransferase involved in cell wall biosynthesis [Nocardia transvalensis]|uniref:Glycosyltransferase involved in cell wall biosynthesis n=1 Tax=Nocardia transvalensis TaxID=37333 RepID=A0A7W9PMS8_9NOCA|nr:glycosyltransferase [Nocardia transvalensis]MBB5918951.1 glycosyltransferase involved in cell wall biosynthesis [Nocardia transvalensis]